MADPMTTIDTSPEALERLAEKARSGTYDILGIADLLYTIAAEKRVAQTVEAEREELAKQFDKMSLRYVDAHWPLLADRLKKGATLLRTPGPVIPPGWVLVPKVPTPRMCAALYDLRREQDTLDVSASDGYAAMLAAAPKYEGEK